MAWQDYIDEVQMLYVAYYQRPADPAGLRYWAQVIDNQGIQAAVNGFVNSPEAQSLYSSYYQTGDIAGLITAVYQAAFNRTPEPDGLDYWTKVYNNGWATLGTIVWEIVNGARNQDLITLQNKLESAMNFTNALDPDGDYLPPYQATYAGDADAAAGRAFLHDVTYDPATVKTVDAAKAYIQAHIADPGDPLYGTGQNINLINLTTGLDNILIPTPDTVDNIYGVAGNLEGMVNTYNSYDIIQGNGHTILTLTLSPLLGLYSPAGPAKVTNVDKINLISGGSGTMYFDASNWSDIGSINLNAGVNGLHAEFGQLQVGTDLYVGNLVEGTLGAYYTDSVYVGIYSDRQAQISYVDGTVNAYAQAGKNVTLSVSATADMTPITLGNISMIGASANSATIDIKNAQYFAGDITVGNVSVNGFDDISMHIKSTGHGPLSDPSNITVGNVNVSVNDILSASIRNSGYNNVGDVKVGNVSIAMGYSATGSFVIHNSAYNNLITDDVTVGDITVGNISVQLNNNASLAMAISNSATASKGDATVGNVTVGDVSFNVGKNATAYLYVSNSASAYVGNATAGDITIGNISATVADSGYAYAYIDNYVVAGTSSLPGTGDAKVGNVKVGDVSFNVGANAKASLTVSNSAVNYGIGTVTVGDITVGNISATLANTNGLAQFYISNYAIGNAIGDVTVGNVKVGDVSFVVGQSASANLTIYNHAQAAGFGNATAGDITVGNISVTLSQSKAFASVYLSNFASAAIDNAKVGDIKVGNITVSANNTAGSVSFFFTATNTASAILGTPSIGNITVGNITVSDVAGSLNNLATLTNWFNPSTSGTITVGNVDYSGYITSGATIDLKEFKGAPVVKGTIKGDTITDTTDTNAIYLGLVGASHGDGELDTVTFIKDNSGKTLTTCDKVYNFESGLDVLQIQTDADNVDFGGSYSNFAAFLLAANASILGGNDIFYGYVGSGSYIAVNYNSNTDKVLDYVIQVVGVHVELTDIVPVLV